MKKEKTKFVVRPSRLAACTVLSGDVVVAGQLLYRIYQRQENMTPLEDQDDGRKCISLTRPEWMTDTGLTRHQYDRALKILKRRQLIEVRYKKLRKRDKHLRTRIYLPDSTISAIADIMKCEGKSAGAETVAKVKSGEAETVSKAVSVAPADIKNVKFKEENGEESENDFFEKKSDTHPLQEESKKENLEEKSKESGVCKKSSSLSDEKVRELIPALYKHGKTAVPHITKSLVDTAKTCIDRLDDAGCKLVFLDTVIDDDDDHPVFTTPGIRALALIMLSWHEFCVFLKLAKGAWNIPPSPQFYYMKLHLDGAVDYLRFKEWLHNWSGGKSETYFSADKTLPENREAVEIFYGAPGCYMLDV